MQLIGTGLASAGLGFSFIGRAQESPAFNNPLHIPRQDHGVSNDGEREFLLNLQAGSREFLPGTPTPTYGINGDYLGPVLRFNRGEQVFLQVRNEIGERTSLHWHGFHLPPTSDGGPHQPIANGETRHSRFEILQLGGTYWYHSHILDNAGEQVCKGLAGMIIVDDPEVPDSLPSEYGIDDVPLIIQDRRFSQSGEFEYLNRYDDLVMGYMGDRILVNGTVGPLFRPATRRVRFRILNAANARTFRIALSDGRPFQQIACDGGLLDAPIEMTSLLLAPAERVEIVVAFKPGEIVNLVSLARESGFPEYPGGMSRMMRRLNAESFDLLTLACESSLRDGGEVPARLTTVYRLPEAAAVNTRTFLLSMGAGMRSGEDKGPGSGGRNGTGGGYGGGNYFINGRVMAMDYINERVPLNTTEIWVLNNNSPMMHPFHIHNGQFQILDRNGNPPPANEMGWKDTVQVGSGETVRLIMRFTDYTDEKNPYMYHCHILEHEDRGMMGQFVLV